MIFSRPCSDDDSGTFEKIKQVLEELDVINSSLSDWMLLREVCQIVSSRAAYLAAAGVRI